MTHEDFRAPPVSALRDSRDVLAQVLGGLWPTEAGLEALLDRVESRRAGQ